MVGSVLLRVWLENFRCRLDCKLVDSPTIHPLLGRKACLGMKIIAYLDNDELNKPDTGDAPVYALDEPRPVSAEELLSKNPRVFRPGVGLLEGKYHITLALPLYNIHQGMSQYHFEKHSRGLCMTL